MTMRALAVFLIVVVWIAASASAGPPRSKGENVWGRSGLRIDNGKVFGRDLQA
jgi:hypothetical protein